MTDTPLPTRKKPLPRPHRRRRRTLAAPLRLARWLWATPRRRWALVAAAVAIAAILLLVSLWPAPPDPSLRRVQEAGVLRVGLDASFPPLETTDGLGHYGGYDVDLAGAVAQALGVRAEFVNISFDSLYDALTSRKIDVIISGLLYAPEMTRDVLYSASYLNVGPVLVVRRDRNIAQTADLAGKTVAVELGSEGQVVAQHLAEKEVAGLVGQTYPTVPEALAALRRGEVAAVIADPIAVSEFVQEEAAGDDLRVVGGPLSDESYVIAAHRYDRTLLKAIDQVLQELRAQGFLDQLADHWFPLPR
jgi:polar amino acid transport system substrate-binding protein